MALPCFAALAQTIPLDKQVTTGKLANGFTYYIRHNAEPQKRVQLYLVNKVGSLLEDEDQQGLAHFMEHMIFLESRCLTLLEPFNMQLRLWNVLPEKLWEIENQR